MKQNRERGFTLVEALIIVLILAVVAFAGWWVWKNKQDKNKKANNTSTSQTSQSSKKTGDASSSNSNPKQTSAASASYLTIKEWGVRVKLTDKIMNAYYIQKADVPDAVYASLNEYKGTECAADRTWLVAYSRFTKDDTDSLTGDKMISEHPDASKIGDYYYFATHPQATCTDDAQAQAKAKAETDAFMAAGKTFEAIP